MKRRHFFKTAAASAAVGLTAQFGSETAEAREPLHPGKEGAPYPDHGDEPVEHLSTYYPDYADKNLWIRKENQVLTVYRTDPNQKYPYLYPLIGPASRVSVTADRRSRGPITVRCFWGLTGSTGGTTGRRGAATARF